MDEGYLCCALHPAQRFTMAEQTLLFYRRILARPGVLPGAPRPEVWCGRWKSRRLADTSRISPAPPAELVARPLRLRLVACALV